MRERNILSARQSGRDWRWVEFILLAVLFLWQFLFVGKGIDGSDTSFYLANYKWAFVEESIVQSGTIFSDLTGALLYHLLPRGHLLVFRLLDALANCAVFGCALYLCGRENRIPVLLAVLFGAFYLKRGTMTLSYNTFSVLLFALAMCLLLAGLRNRRRRDVALAGLLAGVNVLFRLPNLLQASMALAILLYGWKDGWKRRDIWHTAAVFAVSYVCAVLAGLGVGCLYKGIEGVLQGYGMLAAIGANRESSHGIGNMLANIWRQVSESMKPLGLFLVSAGALAVLTAVFEEKAVLPRRTIQRLSLGLAVLGGSLYGAFLALWFVPGWMICFFAVIALLLSGVTILCARCLDAERLTWAWFLMISVLCVSVGTDNGLLQCLYFGAHILGLTAALLLYWRQQDELLAGGKAAKVFRMRPFCTAMLTLLLVAGLVSTGIRLLFSYTYREAPYAQLTTTLEAPELAGMKTTPERAAILDAFYEDTRALEPMGHPLATVGHFSVGYLIYDQPPFFERTWPDLNSYSVEQYAARLAEREEQGILPIIAVVDIGDGEGLCTSDATKKKYDMLMAMAERHDYICVRDDEAYKLYVPPDCVEKG